MAIKHDSFWGKMNSDVPPPSWHKGFFIFGGAFFTLMGAGALFGSCALFGEGGGAFFMVLMGIGAIIGGIACLSAPKKEMAAWQKFHDKIEEERELERLEEEKQKEKYKRGQWKLPASFAKKCEKNKIYDVNSESSYQKAKIIAEGIMENEGIPREYWYQYVTKEALAKQFELIEADKQKKKAKEYEKKEKEIEIKNKEYSGKVGADKSVSYCKDHIHKYKRIIAECNANTESVLNGGEVIYNASKGRESSWAIHGGIASGIAGPAAGIAAAYDTERRNQEVRNRNNQLADTIIQMQTLSLNNISKQKTEAEEQLEYWEKKLENVKLKLIENMSGKKLLESMQPQILKVEKSISGNVLVDVKLIPPNGLRIYEEMGAVVDGSFKVEIYTEGERVGAAFCALPFEGLSYSKTFNVVCTKLSKQADTYEAKVSPHHLWAVEA